jgi:DNA-binding MarR family transcriptional regulator
MLQSTPTETARSRAGALLALIDQPEIRGLSLQSLSLLLTIHINPSDLSLNEMSERSSSRATTFRCLARLIELHLIEARDHPLDRRRTIYALSASGSELLNRCLGSAKMDG